ncbi:hypothetical protein EVAR_32308_1 [Eumeta japonica]|uniref:Uncharacterized protein n=1 Tax=Eumeta variegata TaxID=151549 RepID=A0A4C1WD09_EUMVA|nr:hypothetical protein EVAR_32308_1 [Eumeta japonica]
MGGGDHLLSGGSHWNFNLKQYKGPNREADTGLRSKNVIGTEITNGSVIEIEGGTGVRVNSVTETETARSIDAEGLSVTAGVRLLARPARAGAVDRDDIVRDRLLNVPSQARNDFVNFDQVYNSMGNSRVVRIEPCTIQYRGVALNR